MEFGQYIYDLLQRHNLNSATWVIDILVFLILLSFFFKYALYPIYKYVGLPIYNVCTKISSTCDEVKKMSNEVNEIKKELKTNGGNSIKDLVIKLNKDISMILSVENKMNSKQNAILNFLGLDFCKGLAFYETDRNGNCKFVTHRWCEITGRTESESQDKGWILAIHPDDRHEVNEEFYHCVAEKRPFSMEYRIMHTSGNVVRVYGYAFPLTDGNDIYGYIGALKLLEVSLYENKIEGNQQ